MERSKSRESNPMVHTLEGSTVELSKSREIIPVVDAVSYAEVVRINILLN